MNRRRLEHTARAVLPFVEPEQLRMWSWRCGTSACAFGHECLSDFGKREGLTFDARWGTSPVFNGKEEFAAIREYYNIDSRAAHWIFAPESYRHGLATPAEVASRIESLLASESP